MKITKVFIAPFLVNITSMLFAIALTARFTFSAIFNNSFGAKDIVENIFCQALEFCACKSFNTLSISIDNLAEAINNQDLVWKVNKRFADRAKEKRENKKEV